MVRQSCRTTKAGLGSFAHQNAGHGGTTPTQSRKTGRQYAPRSARCAAGSFPTDTSTDWNGNIVAVVVQTGAEKGRRTGMSKKIIGVYPMFNTGGICVHAIDDAEDKVLASVNGENPEWCEMAEKPQPEEDGSEMESGFLFGSFFVPFSGVIRM